MTEFSPEVSEAFTSAILKKDIHTVERLLQDPRINISGHGALEMGCLVENTQMVRTLLDDPRIRSSDKTRALEAAARRLKIDTFLELLADPDIDPNWADYERFPLVATCDAHKMEYFRALLAHPKILSEEGGKPSSPALRKA